MKKLLLYFKGFKVLSIVLPILFLLTGCWDKIELENRGLVNAIGIDKYVNGNKSLSFEEKEKNSEDRFTISMSLPSIATLSGKGGNDKEGKTVKKSSNETVSAAMRLIDAGSSQRLYFGHTKLAILGKELLGDDKLLKETIDALERNREISRKTTILSVDGKASGILEEDIKGEALIGMFVSKFYKNSKTTVAIAFQQDLENIIKQLSINGAAIVPQIAIKEGEIKLGGAAVIKDYKLVEYIDDEITRGYLWVKEKGEDGEVVGKYKDTYIPLRVSNMKTKLDYKWENDNIICNAQIDIDGNIEEYMFGEEKLSVQDIKKLEEVFEDVISEEINKSFSYFQKDANVDIFDFKEELRKKYYDIYLEVKDDWESEYENMKIIPLVNVKIKNLGSTK